MGGWRRGRGEGCGERTQSLPAGEERRRHCKGERFPPPSLSPSPPLLLPPRNLSSPLPFFLSHPQAVAAAEPVWAAPDAGAWGKHEDQSIIPRALPREPGAWKAPRAVGRSFQEWRAPSALWEHMGLDHQAEGERGT